MGIVHAKSNLEERSEVGNREPPINFEHVRARVQKIHIDGIERTKDDILVSVVQDLFVAKDFKQVVLKCREIQSRFNMLGLFESSQVLIDTSRGADAATDGLEITFTVKELVRRKAICAASMAGSNEGSLVVGACAPNAFGRGEKIQLEYAHGTYSTSGFNVNFLKPIVGLPNTWIKGSAFQQNALFPPSGFKETDRGMFSEISFESAPKVYHQLRWEGVWRELTILSSCRSFLVREEMGHTLKSSIQHTLTVDHRDDHILPSRGVLFRMVQELAGLGGDVGFLKSEAQLQGNIPLPYGCVLQGTLNAGSLNPRSNDKNYNIADRFFLGGPMTLRGFEMRGAGPHSDGCAVGADAYWGGGIHLYTPLPFLGGGGGFVGNFRVHFFGNVGNIGTFHIGDDYQSLVTSLWQNRRMSLGSGLLIRFGRHARLEINFCVPMNVQANDRAVHGLQFGGGIEFW